MTSLPTHTHTHAHTHTHTNQTDLPSGAEAAISRATCNVGKVSHHSIASAAPRIPALIRSCTSLHLEGRAAGNASGDALMVLVRGMHVWSGLSA